MDQEIFCENHMDAAGNPAGGWVKGRGIAIDWQNGPLGTGADRKEPNGAFVEGVIKAAIARLQYYQNSRFACEENDRAIGHLAEALVCLHKRTKAREDRGVEGTHAV